MSEGTLTLACAAKLNLSLAITGRREDGFHELVSLITPTTLADTLTLRWHPLEASDLGETATDVLRCDDPTVPTGADNLVLRAVEAFRERTGRRGVVTVDLGKRIPAGAGLGGGSSDAAMTLDALNRLTGAPLAASELEELAAGIGSDCPLFLRREAVVVRGRGEILEALPMAAREALASQRAVIFKPTFSIATAWAYRRFRELGPSAWADATQAEARLHGWLQQPECLEKLPLENSLEAAAFSKYVALPTLLNQLRAEVGCRCQMTGSGSACFVLVEDVSQESRVRALVREALGPEAFLASVALQWPTDSVAFRG